MSLCPVATQLNKNSGESMPRYVAIDVETTGLSEKTDRVVEFAAVDLSSFVDNGKVLDGSQKVNALRFLFNPEMPMPRMASSINNLYDKDLKDQPLFSEKAHEIKEFLSGATLVAHNAAFDKKFIVAEFQRAGIEFRCRTACTLKKARASLPGRRSYKLEDLNKDFGIHSGKAHSALDDAITAGKLFLYMKSLPDDVPHTAPLNQDQPRASSRPTNRKSENIQYKGLSSNQKVGLLVAFFALLIYFLAGKN